MKIIHRFVLGLLLSQMSVERVWMYVKNQTNGEDKIVSSCSLTRYSIFTSALLVPSD